MPVVIAQHTIITAHIDLLLTVYWLLSNPFTCVILMLPLIVWHGLHSSLLTEKETVAQSGGVPGPKSQVEDSHPPRETFSHTLAVGSLEYI